MFICSFAITNIISWTKPNTSYLTELQAINLQFLCSRTGCLLEAVIKHWFPPFFPLVSEVSCNLWNFLGVKKTHIDLPLNFYKAFFLGVFVLSERESSWNWVVEVGRVWDKLWEEGSMIIIFSMKKLFQLYTKCKTCFLDCFWHVNIAIVLFKEVSLHRKWKPSQKTRTRHNVEYLAPMAKSLLHLWLREQWGRGSRKIV